MTVISIWFCVGVIYGVIAVIAVMGCRQLFFELTFGSPPTWVFPVSVIAGLVWPLLLCLYVVGLMLVGIVSLFR